MLAKHVTNESGFDRLTILVGIVNNYNKHASRFFQVAINDLEFYDQIYFSYDRMQIVLFIFKNTDTWRYIHP